MEIQLLHSETYLKPTEGYEKMQLGIRHSCNRQEEQNKILFNLRLYRKLSFSQGQFYSFNYLWVLQLFWLFKTILLLLVLFQNDTACYIESHKKDKKFKATYGFINAFYFYVLKQYLSSENEGFIKITTECIRALHFIQVLFALFVKFIIITDYIIYYY